MGRTDKVKKTENIQELEEIEKPILETNNYSSIINTCNDGMENRNMNCIIGGAGLGKSTGLISYVYDHPGNVFYVKVTKSMSVRIFYSSIYNAKGLLPFDKELHIHFLIRQAAGLFNDELTKKLLIIDEAGKFTPPMLEYLHELRDLTKKSMGIILAGPEYFLARLNRWNDVGIPGVPELYSRINVFQTLNVPTFQEIKAIIQANNIKDSSFELENKGILNFRKLKFNINNYLIEQKRNNKN
jgi:DNA transposition AAA+ family ATPase